MIPVVVVVDSRNVHGQAGEVLGRKLRPSVEGVVAALRSYGLDAVSVCVGLALVQDGRQPLSDAMTAAQSANAAYAAQVSGHSLGQVLAGRLVERFGDREEKLVDVLCAVQVCRAAYDISQGRSAARAIVVVSKDIDISPSYTFAAELGVPVYAFASSVVHTRPGSWLLGSEDTFTTMCSGPSVPATSAIGLVGQALRTELVSMLGGGTGGVRQLEPWRAIYSERRRNVNYVVLRHGNGVDAVIPEADLPGWQPNRTYDLAVVAADFGDRGGLFPRACLSMTPQEVSDDVKVVTVDQWMEATRVRVSGGGKRIIDVAPGTLMPGDSVLVQLLPRDARPQRPMRLIGPLSLVARPADWGEQTAVRVVRVVGKTRMGDATAVMDGSTTRSVLKLPRGHAPVAGTRYAAVLIDVLRSGQPLLMAVSSQLPA
jgi:hypothetical protein